MLVSLTKTLLGNENTLARFQSVLRKSEKKTFLDPTISQCISASAVWPPMSLDLSILVADRDLDRHATTTYSNIKRKIKSYVGVIDKNLARQREHIRAVSECS